MNKIFVRAAVRRGAAVRRAGECCGGRGETSVGRVPPSRPHHTTTATTHRQQHTPGSHTPHTNSTAETRVPVIKSLNNNQILREEVFNQFFKLLKPAKILRVPLRTVQSCVRLRGSIRLFLEISQFAVAAVVVFIEISGSVVVAIPS